MTKNFKILSGSTLKLIAVISMLIDHTAFVLYKNFGYLDSTLFTFRGDKYSIYLILRFIGRLAFPIFCFLIVEGFLHTRNVKKYLMRLALFAAISEIPFNFMMSGSPVDISHQNVYFTLFLGVLALYIYETLGNHVFKFLSTGIILALTHFLHTDYGMKGILLILFIYALRNTPSMQMLFSFFILPEEGRLFTWAAFLPINMYNGERGFIKTKGTKLAFYAFYPVHIALLVVMTVLLKFFL